MSSKKPPSNTNDSSKALKNAFEKLSSEVQKLGMVLGVKEENLSAPVVETTKTETGNVQSEKNEYVKEMTQDEKRAQRDKKAALKKAKAEAAAAKKLAGNNANQSKNQGSQKPQEKKEINKTEPTPQNSIEIKEVTTKVEVLSIHNNHVKSKKEVKSVLKTNKGHPSAGQQREVQFDLQSNTTVIRTSESEEAVASAIPEPPVVPLEDASSIAHIHPAFLTLSARCEKELITDLEQVCEEFINAFKEFLADWSSIRVKESHDPSTFGHDLDVEIRPQFKFLTQSGRWPLPYALGNIVRALKREILKMDGSEKLRSSTKKDLNLAQTEIINDWLDDTLGTNFVPAYNVIAQFLMPKMKNSSCILTYDWCPVVNHVLHSSMEQYPEMRVCFVDSELNGRAIRHVDSFVEKGYKCQYTDLKSISYAVQQCSMVVLGCSAILSNGCVATTKGAIQLALTAKAFNVPVLVLSQYFKFVDKVQSYSRMALLGRENVELLPSTLVTAIVTDIRILPPTAAPAVLKAKQLEQLD